VEEFHGQLKIGGEKKRKRVLLDWRENGKRRRRRMADEFSWSCL
jgi:hypothetical protein